MKIISSSITIKLNGAESRKLAVELTELVKLADSEKFSGILSRNPETRALIELLKTS